MTVPPVPFLRRRLLAPATLAVALAFAVGGCRKDPEPAEAPADTTATMPAATTVVDVAMADPQFSTLVDLISTAGLADQLKGAGPFTVFAPTNDAFAKLPAGTADSLKLDKNRQRLTDILLYHVTNGNVKAADLKGMATVTALNNGSVAVTTEGEAVKVGGATVTSADFAASNGTIHVIDTVLMPPSAQ